MKPNQKLPENYFKYDPWIQEFSSLYKMPWQLCKAQVWQESAFDPNAVSSCGAVGLMQLMPETAAQLGVTNPFDPGENIMAGTRYLRLLLDRYRGDLKLALAAYNWGMGNLEKRPEAMPDETKNYIAQVETRYLNDLKT